MANAQIQNPRNFTLQILHATNDEIVGTGFVVSDSGLVVTCAHVIEAAAGSICQDVEVGAYFVKSSQGWRAKVVRYFEGYDDDVVLLQLEDESGGFVLPNNMDPAKLGKAEDSENHRFRSFGYSSLGSIPAISPEGSISLIVESPTQIYDKKLDNYRVPKFHTEPVELRCGDIDEGMSGAAVQDIDDRSPQKGRVVGIVSATWFADPKAINWAKHNNTAWAVNARVLALPPIALSINPLNNEDEVLDAAITPMANASRMDKNTMPTQKLVNAPPIFEEWVGREELLQALDGDWADPARRVVELIGFGGEGKSSVARRWVARVLESNRKPQGVFWWGFESNPSIDEFFEELLKFLVDGINTQALPSAAEKIQVINAMLVNDPPRGEDLHQRYIFVLDGLEVLQYDEGEDYGLLRNSLLREWLRDFAKADHNSFALLTSRFPVFDLLDFTTFVHREVKSLTVEEGQELLIKVGVKGSLLAMRSLVADWDGYALVLSTIGAYLVDRYGGDIQYMRKIPSPISQETRYEQVGRVLGFYDEHLTLAEREFLQTCSAFRVPVHESSFKRGVLFRSWDGIVRSPDIPELQKQLNFIELAIIWGQWLLDLIFQTKRSRWVRVRERLNKPMASLDNQTFAAMVHRLVDYRMLRHNQEEKCYTIHPLLREYFQQFLREKPEQKRQVHHRLKEFYLANSPPVVEFPTLSSLAPLIEAVHHACQAGEYDEASDILWKRIYQKNRYVIYCELSTWETNLAIIQEFFPQGDISQEPQVSQPGNKAFILNEIALCLEKLGRLHEAPPLYKRSYQILIAESNWSESIIRYGNLANLYVCLGDLAASAEVARKAIALSDRAENKYQKRHSLTYLAHTTFLQEDRATVGKIFQQAEVLERELYSNQYLCGGLGILHAKYLLRHGELDYAWRVTRVNLEISKRNHWLNDTSRSHCILGDLDINPQVHYAEALKIARSISDLGHLITVLLSSGRYLVGLGFVPISPAVAQAVSPDQSEQCYMLSLRPTTDGNPRNNLALARQYLDEALTYATTSGYRLYEADLRIALAWLHWHKGDLITAQREADRAKRSSEEMGYFWGRVDAAALFAQIDHPST